MAERPFVVTIPVRGVVIDNPDLTLDAIFDEPWTLVGPEQYGILADAQGRNDSVRGNIDVIAERLAPSSLLLVRYYPGQRTSVWDEVLATRVLAALNIALLLSDILTNPPRPRPLFRARYAEYCDLPLAFDAEGTKSTGHTSRLGLLAGDDLPRLHLDNVVVMIGDAPQVVRDVLQGKRLDARQSRLAEGMVNILGAFETLSTGAFVSRLVSATECLLDAHAEGGVKSWTRIEARLRATVKSKLVPDLTQIRHEYVHAGLQPANDVASLQALAMAVECWGVLEGLYTRISRHSDVEVLLDCAARASQAKSDELEMLAPVMDAIGFGPSAEVEWIRSWLGGDAT